MEELELGILNFCPSGNPKSPVQENTRREARPPKGRGLIARGSHTSPWIITALWKTLQWLHDS